MEKIQNRKCRKCGKEYPNTLEFFSKKGNRLRDICKECDNRLRREREQKKKN